MRDVRLSPTERDAAVRRLFPLVKRVAKRVHRMVPGRDRDDLVGDGCVGAIKAVDRFDPQRGVPLERYAVRVIAGAMLNGMRSMDTVSERVRRELRRAESERFEVAAHQGALPSALEMESRRPQLRRARAAAAQSTPLSLDCALPAGEQVECDWSADPARIAEANAQRRALRNAMERLPQRYRDLIVLHYSYEISLSGIGRAMNISAQRSSQIHLAAMKKLRALMHAAP